MIKLFNILIDYVIGNNEIKDEWKFFDYFWDCFFIFLEICYNVF